MPFLDVSELLTDPDFCDTFTVTRQTQTVDNNGRNSVQLSTFEMVGVVTIGSIPPFRQTEEAINSTKSITVHSQDRLLDPTNGYSPDIVTYLGDRYIVKKCANWSRFGAGFYTSDCEQQHPVGEI